MEDMLYEAESVRRFVGLKLSDALPDETNPELPTSIGTQWAGEEPVRGDQRHLELRGLKLREGTIVDASIIEAPSSTKNRAGERDPEIRRRRGTSGISGEVAIGVDSVRLGASVSTTAATRMMTETHHFARWGDESRECTSGRKTWGVVAGGDLEAGSVRRRRRRR